MHHPFPPLGSRALSTLHAGGLVLLPTANLWRLVAHVHQPAAVDRLFSVCPPSLSNRPELIFADADTLRKWCPKIPPRLDILLEFHKRPVTLLVPAGKNVPLRMVDQRGEVAVRLAHDSFCYRICEDLEAPVVSCCAMGPGVKDLPVRFGKIRSDVLRASSYTVARRQREDIGKQLCVIARLNDAGEIEFPR